MRNIPNPSQNLLCFELTQEQVLHISISLASDINTVADLMPIDFHLSHLKLLDMFLSQLPTLDKQRVLFAMSHQGGTQ